MTTGTTHVTISDIDLSDLSAAITISKTTDLPHNTPLLIKKIRVLKNNDKFSFIATFHHSESEFYITRLMWNSIYKRNINVIIYHGKEDELDQFSKHIVDYHYSKSNPLPEIIKP